MRNSTLAGLLIGVLAIFGAFFLEGGTFASLFLIPAMMIVFGGTIAAAIIGTSWKQVGHIPRLISVAMFPKKHDVQPMISLIIRFSGIARREGILALDKHLDDVSHPYLKKLFQIAIDGVDPQLLRQIAENELYFIQERHQANIQLFVRMGGYSPTMGIIGTVMGLIATLASVGGDPNELIHHIASAFIATMWGIFMANLVWLPIGDKLKTLHDEEIQLLRLMIEGVSAVQLGEVPSVIRAQLSSVLPLEEQQSLNEVSAQPPVFHVEPPPVSTPWSQN